MATARAIRNSYDERLAPLELNLSQASLLSLVAEFGRQTQTQAAGRLGLGRAATGTLVDALQGRSLIHRVADERDRRIWWIELTPIGADIATRVAAVDVALREELRAGFSRADRQQLAGLLLRLQANLKPVALS